MHPFKDGPLGYPPPGPPPSGTPGNPFAQKTTLKNSAQPGAKPSAAGEKGNLVYGKIV